MYILHALAALAGLMAAVVSWLFNGKLITVFGNNKAVIFIGPAIEESLKTGFASALGASIIISHTAFGVAEAIWELSSYKRGVVAGIFAMATHLFYGVVTIIVAEKAGVYIALVAAYTVHMLWNYWVVNYQKIVSSR